MRRIGRMLALALCAAMLLAEWIALPAGAAAGTLQRQSLRMLDPSGDLREGVPFLAPAEIE